MTAKRPKTTSLASRVALLEAEVEKLWKILQSQFPEALGQIQKFKAPSGGK